MIRSPMNKDTFANSISLICEPLILLPAAPSPPSSGEVLSMPFTELRKFSQSFPCFIFHREKMLSFVKCFLYGDNTVFFSSIDAVN